MRSAAEPWSADAAPGAGAALSFSGGCAKRAVTIAVVDLGLGGLAVLSAIERRLRGAQLAPEVKLVYYAAKRGLDKILQRLSCRDPDVIFIACNTLSAYYSRSEYVKTAAIPVIPVIPFGVRLFAQAMQSDLVAPVLLIFGTPGTARSGLHRDRLVDEHGVPPERIVFHACQTLHDSIEKFGVESDVTRRGVLECVKGAWQELARRQLPPATTVFAGLACTHYGYAAPLWASALQQVASDGGGCARDDVGTAVLDPNESMADSIFEGGAGNAGLSPRVSVEVLSDFVIAAFRIANIGPVLSAPVCAALQQYSPMPAQGT